MSQPILETQLFSPPVLRICQRRNIPFSRLGQFIPHNFGTLCNDIDSDWRRQRLDEDDLGQLVQGWIIGFNDTDSSEGALGASMYLANEAMLGQTANAWSSTTAPKHIYSSRSRHPKAYYHMGRHYHHWCIDLLPARWSCVYRRVLLSGADMNAMLLLSHELGPAGRKAICRWLDQCTRKTRQS